MLARANEVGVVAIWGVELKSRKTHIKMTIFGAVEVSGYWILRTFVQSSGEKLSRILDKRRVTTSGYFLVITPVLVDCQI